MKLPVVSGTEVVKNLTKIGFEVVGRSGSHVRLKKRVNEKVWIVIVPMHRELAKGTLSSIIRQSGLTRDEFIKTIKR
jgi:predicted RNA binding protein YcfA (HicA-like mRNA interferase family)